MKQTLLLLLLLLVLSLNKQLLAQTPIVTVPDANFRTALVNANSGSPSYTSYGITDIGGNQVSVPDISMVTYLDVSGYSIADLTGIEAFTSLQTLRCLSNPLTSLDLSKNTALLTLDCFANQLTSLDLSKNTALQTLYCSSNQLTSLDVSNNTALQTLRCFSNQLTSLDVSNNIALEELYCYSNQLTNLDISGATALQTLRCYSNELTSLDVSQNTALQYLYCYSNQLTNLDVSNNTNLVWLDCYSNELKSLNVSNNNTALSYLRCYSNQLTNLDISGATSLQTFLCNSNQLTSLDVSNNNGLYTLYCYSNQLTNLDVSGATTLQTLYCYSNQLTSLDVSDNTALDDLDCSSNPLPIVYIPEGHSYSLLFKESYTQTAVLRSFSTTPSISAGQTGVFELGTTGAIVNITSNSSGAASLSASTGSNPTVVGSLPGGLVNISQDKYWTISPSGLTSFTYNLIIDTRGMSGIDNFNTLHVLQRPNASTAWSDVAVSRYEEPFLIVNGLTSFSDFVIGGGSDNPLPVELSGFSGTSTSNGIELSWATQSETNNAGFVILRNGIEIAGYKTSEALEGHGSTSNKQTYSYIDGDVSLNETYIYELVSVDYSGARHSYSQTVEVKVVEAITSGKPIEYALKQNYPNPFNPSTTITYTMKEVGVATLKVYDVLGRLVIEQTKASVKGENQINFNGSKLTSGMYYYQLNAEGFSKTLKMMLVK